ncbi:response regulator [Verrucomicrobium spinosum]|uniref:response regulator n=1 Tax=Verrucomicrobium spinosum TaxID=2736 RepID=UPI000A9A72AB|nr:response regulator [Verrucomicrobium spinosum]
MRLLFIEDATRLRKTVARALTRLGHAVDEASSAEEGAQLAELAAYDAVILDIMLPGQSGLELLATWRQQQVDTPVLLLTALDSVEDRVRGLVTGADDYLIKPFAIIELAARLEALVRRRHGKPDSRIRVGPLEIDFAARTVSRWAIQSR